MAILRLSFVSAAALSQCNKWSFVNAIPLTSKLIFYSVKLVVMLEFSC